MIYTIFALSTLNRVLFHIVFPAGYLVLTLSFLNNLYENKVLFAWQKGDQQDKDIKLFYFSDVFCVFWLVLAAIPNALFAYDYCVDILFGLSLWQRKVFFAGISVALVFVMGCVVSGRVELIIEGGSWRTKLESLINKGTSSQKYSILEMISMIIVTIEATGVVACIAFYYFGFMQVPETLAISTLAASIILFVYWFMLILSRVFCRMIIGDSRQTNPLFSTLHCCLGAMAILAIVASVYLLSSVPHSNENSILENYRFVIGSILIPFAPIAFQLVQIMSPKYNQKD